MPQWIRFVLTSEQPPKTKRWMVVTTGGEKEVGGIVIGRVSWWGAWRSYAFFPNPQTLYEPQCLRDLAAFCGDQTRAHRAAAKERRA